jgi:hypothetical protein
MANAALTVITQEGNLALRKGPKKQKGKNSLQGNKIICFTCTRCTQADAAAIAGTKGFRNSIGPI